MVEKKLANTKNSWKKNLKNITEHESEYNAFISIADSEELRQKARNLDKKSDLPLRGFTLAVKDNINTIDFKTTGGSPGLKDFRPKQDATVITRIKSAGGIIVGKSNLHELAFGITNNNVAFGATHNASKRGYISGGSSGGSAVAVALGMVRAALGTDTGGSARIPAALNGIVGFRPTVGRYPADGLVPISNTRDTVGPMAQTVADVILLDRVLSGDKAELPIIDPAKLRIGIPKIFYRDIDAEVSAISLGVLDKLRAKGVQLINVDMPELFELNNKVSFPIALYECGVELPHYLAKYHTGISLSQLHDKIVSPDVKGIIGSIMNGAIPEAVYREVMQKWRPDLQQMFASYFKDHRLDALIVPVTPVPARPIATSDQTVELNGKQAPTFATYIRNVDPSSNAGIPGISVPAGTTKQQLPVGMEIEAAMGDDLKLLAIAQWFQQHITAK